MKLIVYFAFLACCLSGINTTIISDLTDKFLNFFISATQSKEGDDEKLNDNSPSLDSDDVEKNKHNADDPNMMNTALEREENEAVEHRPKRKNEWARKKYDFNFAIEPKQAVKREKGEEIEEKKEEGKEEGKEEEKRKDKNVPEENEKSIFMTQYKTGDGVDQVIPLTQSPKNNVKKIGKSLYHMDHILNSLRRHPMDVGEVEYSAPHYIIQPNLARKVDYRRKDDSGGSSYSSSREMKDFKDEFRELWLHKKFEALNQTQKYRGDVVNMVAARPWGVPCGDPNQHDMPWGVCMLAAECEAEFRIYRGDLFCGRTQFICCGLQLTTYDTYQGFDVSFDDKSLSTDSEEKRNRDKTSKEKGKKKKDSDRKKRRNDRNKRKRKIKKHIKKIIKEIRKILNKQYRNGTKQRKMRTKQLKKFIKDLKKQYKKDRQSVKDLHANEMMLIDKALMERLKQIQKMNHHFTENATFREIVLKGMITKKSARMLLEAYPELDEFLEARRAGGAEARRAGGRGVSRESDDNVLEYDVEYGYLYY